MKINLEEIHTQLPKNSRRLREWKLKRALRAGWSTQTESGVELLTDVSGRGGGSKSNFGLIGITSFEKVGPT